MELLTVNLGVRSYNIYIGSGILAELGSYLQKMLVGKRVLVITNPKVKHLYGEVVKSSLLNAGYTVVVGSMGDGEEYKTMATAERLYDLAYNSGLDRQSAVIALGGGVVGDTAGFVASTYLRGVPFIQVPTTLLAQVDSSVGGKVAVNHPKGKNIIGSFYQPRMVLADVSLLKTLPVRELRSGLAEVIKYGVIWSEEFFGWLEKNIEALLASDTRALIHIVRESCSIKSKVVEADETEGGLRAVLNYGHTFGHAVEVITGYKKFTHGEAVAIGMVVAARLACSLRLLGVSELNRIEELISRTGLPCKLAENISPDEIVESLSHDKKVVGGSLTFVLPNRIGQVEIRKDLIREELIDFLKGL